MADPVKPGDYGDWLRAKNIDQTQAASVPFDALCPNAITTAFSGSAATALAVAVIAGGAGGGLVTINAPTTTVSNTAETWTAVLVRDPAGGGAGGVSTVTADQGASGTQAWPVAVSGGVSVSAIPTVLASISAIPAISAVQSGAWTANVNVTAGNVGVSSMPSVAVSVSAIPAISAVQSGAWTANVSVSANVSQLVSVGSAVSLAVSAITMPALSVGTIAQPIRVMQDTTAAPSTVGFTISASGTTSLIAAPGANVSLGILHVQMQNGDTTLHRCPLLHGATNSTLIPAYAAANAGGFVADFNRPFRAAANVGISISLDANCGTRSVEGIIQYVTLS